MALKRNKKVLGYPEIRTKILELDEFESFIKGMEQVVSDKDARVTINVTDTKGDLVPLRETQLNTYKYFGKLIELGRADIEKQKKLLQIVID